MLTAAEEYAWLSPVILAPAESVMYLDIFIYKATSLPEIDL